MYGIVRELKISLSLNMYIHIIYIYIHTNITNECYIACG